MGRELNQICLGRYQLQLHSSGAGSISIEGRWELRDAAGQVLDAAQPHENRSTCAIHRILDVPITRFALDAPRSFTLFFATGLALTVFDESEQFESFSVHLHGGPSWHV